jgi:hypothetical protein
MIYLSVGAHLLKLINPLSFFFDEKNQNILSNCFWVIAISVIAFEFNEDSPYCSRLGIYYFADLRMTFRQNIFVQDWFRNKLGVGLG